MVRITKRGMTPALSERLSVYLGKLFKKLDSPKDVELLLDELLTPDEQFMVKKRLAIRLFLAEGRRVREIRETLDVSKATICFVRRGLRHVPKKEKKRAPQLTKKRRPPLRYKGFPVW